MKQKRNGWKFSFDQGICPKIREKYTFVRACPKRTVIHINGSHKVIILFHENCSSSYIYDIYMCAFQSRLFVPLYQINYEDVKMGEKIIRERAKLKWTQFGGGIFHPLISTVLKSFLEIRYCSQSSYTFSIFFFYIYLLFSLLFSTIVTFSILSFISYRIFFPEEKCTWHNSL